MEISELNPAHFQSAPGLTWQACLKKTGKKLKLLADIDMLLRKLKKELEVKYDPQYIDMLKQIINT